MKIAISLLVVGKRFPLEATTRKRQMLLPVAIHVVWAALRTTYFDYTLVYRFCTLFVH
jgi:hypothetical protein